MTFFKLPVIFDEVRRAVGTIGHHDYHGVAPCLVQAPDDRSPEALQSGVLRRRKIWDAKLQLLQDVPSAVATPIIHDHDLVGHMMKA